MYILINYADAKYEKVRRLNSRTARWFGCFDKIYEFKPEDMDSEFRTAHKEILSYKRGNGLWLWKPYFIERVIRESKEGDYIFYVDSGSFFVRNPQILLNYVSNENPIFACDQPLIESCWTKPSLFEAINASEYMGRNQFWGGVQLLVVNDYTRRFYKEWLDLCCVHDYISPAGLGKFDPPLRNYGKEFVSHREDQSIFSLLCHKRGIKAHRDISQRGFNPKSYYNQNYEYRPQPHPNDKYKTILFLHKSPNLGLLFWLRYIKNRIRQF